MESLQKSGAETAWLLGDSQITENIKGFCNLTFRPLVHNVTISTIGGIYYSQVSLSLFVFFVD